MGKLLPDDGLAVGSPAIACDEIVQVRHMPVKGADDRRHGPDKHPCVPAEISLAQKCLCELGVRFFAEAHPLVHRRSTGDGPEWRARAYFDVAETRARPR